VGIRIDINWTFVSPALQTVSGILTIKEFDDTVSHPGKLVLECKCKAEPGCKGFSEIRRGEGYSSAIFDKYEDQIRLMVDAYWHGAVLEPKQFYWIPSTL
jgi:hypothetical protein